MISQETIQNILNRLDIIEVIGEFVKLKRRGTNYLGLCPFHNEKTPSFTVSPSKEIYKCFGCGRSGNAISFVMEHEKYSYAEALKWMARKYGIEVEETFVTDEQRQIYQSAESLFIVNNFAQQFFSRMLFETEEGRDIGLSYFRERGFHDEIIRKFQLGYSPEKKDLFSTEAISNQFSADLLVKAGLVVRRSRPDPPHDEQLLDNYRGRVIFPVHNQSGKVLGFGARIMKNNDRAPKYINTPENEIYIKSKILYGAYQARQAIDKSDECLLVEGYTDVISLHQAGIENAVASGGTSLTSDQLRLIKKLTNNLTILYDGDAAGVKAALRGLDLALEEGLNVKMVLIPDNEDPDSYIRRIGAVSFEQFVNQNKKDFVLFQLEVAMREAGDDPARKAEAISRIAETISRINKAEDFSRQQDYIRQCAELLKIDEAGMHALVNKFIRDRIIATERKHSARENFQQEENAKKAEESNYDEATFSLLFKDDLQEKEVARILLEHGNRKWDDSRLVADFIFEEMVDESLIDNKEVIRLLNSFKSRMREEGKGPDKSYFIYHQDTTLSAFAVSLLNFPYQESERWKSEFSKDSGFRKQLFEQSFEEFMHTLSRDNEKKLQGYLKMEEDHTSEEVESVINYLKLRKIKRMIQENQLDMDKPHNPEEREILFQTHNHLKAMEMGITKKMGTVILK